MWKFITLNACAFSTTNILQENLYDSQRETPELYISTS